MGLLAGIGSASLWMPAVFAVLLLAVLYLVDHPRLLPAQHRRIVTLDRAYLDESALRAALADLLGARVTRLEVTDTDLVRDTTVVDVRYKVTERRRDAAAPAGLADRAMIGRTVPSPTTPAGPADRSMSGPTTPAGPMAMPAPIPLPGPFPTPGPYHAAGVWPQQPTAAGRQR
jgi:hypothetical protein